MRNIEFVISVVLTVVTAFLIAIFVPTPDHDPMKKVQLAVAYGMLVLLFLFGFLILAAIASGKIDISQLIAEDGGGASMSRFQLLIFTFVIALSFFLIVTCECKFPDVPGNVLALLGISATTYGVSKGIQASGGLKGKNGAAGAAHDEAPNG
jgi:quinol-cytochrome oxidoreductase complex cytochrome b subunit